MNWENIVKEEIEHDKDAQKAFKHLKEAVNSFRRAYSKNPRQNREWGVLAEEIQKLIKEKGLQEELKRG